MTRSPDQLNDELVKVQHTAVNVQTRYAAHMMLHKAACLSGDREDMQKQRDNLHTLLDVILDNGETLQLLLNEAGYIG